MTVTEVSWRALAHPPRPSAAQHPDGEVVVRTGRAQVERREPRLDDQPGRGRVGRELVGRVDPRPRRARRPARSRRAPGRREPAGLGTPRARPARSPRPAAPSRCRRRRPGRTPSASRAPAKNAGSSCSRRAWATGRSGYAARDCSSRPRRGRRRTPRARRAAGPPPIRPMPEPASRIRAPRGASASASRASPSTSAPEAISSAKCRAVPPADVGHCPSHRVGGSGSDEASVTGTRARRSAPGR